jgi:DNA-binding TFAR19-related protein (PDSD5 family)
VTEETDAVCVVVSEENAYISVAVGGKLTRDLDEPNLIAVLKGLCYKSKTKKVRISKHSTPLNPKA